MTSDIGAVIGPIAAGMIAERWSYSVAFGVTGVIMLAAVIPWALARAPRHDGPATEPVVEKPVTGDTDR